MHRGQNKLVAAVGVAEEAGCPPIEEKHPGRAPHFAASLRLRLWLLVANVTLQSSPWTISGHAWKPATVKQKTIDVFEL
jgi:hypothetical protein